MNAPLEPLPADAPQVGSVWRHYKGGWYQVLSVGRHSETLEPMVLVHDGRREYLVPSAAHVA